MLSHLQVAIHVVIFRKEALVKCREVRVVQLRTPIRHAASPGLWIPPHILGSQPFSEQFFMETVIQICHTNTLEASFLLPRMRRFPGSLHEEVSSRFEPR